MMKTFAATLVVALLPCAVWAQKTSYDFDKAANFSSYKTFSIHDGTKASDPLIDKRIVSNLEAELAKRGLSKSDNGDVIVVYHLAFDEQKNITAWSTGVGPYGWGWGGGWGTTDVRVNEIVVGTLVVDLADAKTKEVVWRGIGVKEIDTTAKPEKRDKSVQQAITKILRNYPPKQKK